MVKIYCIKCKQKTDTTGEQQDMTNSGRYRILGDCSICGTYKSVFTGEGWKINPKSERERSKKDKADARVKRQESSLNRKARKLGLRVLSVDKTSQKMIKSLLKEAEKDAEIS